MMMMMMNVPLDITRQAISQLRLARQLRCY